MLRKAGFSFDDRKKEILGAVVRTHIATGEPVGSVSLARQSSERLSSATIRNICAELEEEGLLTHPHTSAGRLPTDKGYRFYVNNLTGGYQISRFDVARIEGELQDSLANPDRLMEQTGRVLSQLSDNVGIVMSPVPSQELIHHVEFVKLADSRILVITVSADGRVKDQLIRVDSEFTQDELNATSRYLVDNFSGMTLPEIRDEILRRMTEEKALYDKLLRNAAVLCSQSVEEGANPEVLIEGASNILAKPDFSDAEQLRALFKMFEQKGRIVKILNECIESAGRQMVAVLIGSENRSTDLRGCTVIASRCYYGGAAVGGIGVVGPTRIEYDRLIGIVDYVARLFERALQSPGISLH
ncbi:MAG TPA: heat-inducible transcriptional repressor HrcA [Blastocatellia bacterium]|nr:heat-inducible transcriptional repressor HrcA [Blastocatellia bacterium]